MFNSNVNPLWDDSVSNLLIYDDSDCSGVDVENSASSAVVEFIGHTFVDGSIDDDVDDVSDFIGGQSSGDVNSTALSESFSKFISSSSSVSVAMGH